MKLYVLNSSICSVVLLMNLSSTRIILMHRFCKSFFSYYQNSADKYKTEYILEQDLHFDPIYLFDSGKNIPYIFYPLELIKAALVQFIQLWVVLSSIISTGRYKISVTSPPSTLSDMPKLSTPGSHVPVRWVEQPLFYLLANTDISFRKNGNWLK